MGFLKDKIIGLGGVGLALLQTGCDKEPVPTPPDYGDELSGAARLAMTPEEIATLTSTPIPAATFTPIPTSTEMPTSEPDVTQQIIDAGVEEAKRRVVAGEVVRSSGFFVNPLSVWNRLHDARDVAGEICGSRGIEGPVNDFESEYWIVLPAAQELTNFLDEGIDGAVTCSRLKAALGAFSSCLRDKYGNPIDEGPLLGSLVLVESVAAQTDNSRFTKEEVNETLFTIAEQDCQPLEDRMK